MESDPASTIEQRVRRLAADFAALHDPLDQYRYLIALGDGLPRLADAQRTDEHRLPGCEYALWLVSEHDAARDALHFQVDSDARIVRGLAAVVIAVLDGLPPAAVAAVESDFLGEVGLGAQLSAQRRNGLSAMIHEIRARARHVREASGGPAAARA